MVERLASRAFLDALTKTVLTCCQNPRERVTRRRLPPAEARDEDILKSVGLGIAGDAQAALDELRDRIQ